VPADADEETVTAAAMEEPNVQRFIGDAEIRKIVVVPGRLINIVV
jgi:leucyl-tRNA synthetase